jgi:O-antigen/teichoic acid export membrane protein
MIAKKILANTLVQFLGRVLTALLAVISVKLITVSLGVSGYGTYATIYEFVGLFAIIGDFGLYTITIREMAEVSEGDCKSLEKIYANSLSIRAIFTFLVILLVSIGAFFVPAYQGTIIPTGVIICGVAVFFNLFNSIVTSILQYKLKMIYATFSLLIGKIVSVFLIYFFSVSNFSNDSFLYSAIFAGVVGHFIMLCFSLYYVSKIIPIRLELDLDYFKKIIKKSLPYGLALIFSTIYFKIDVTLLSLLTNSKEVGYYAVALRIIEVLAVLPLFFLNSLLGTLTKAVKESLDKVKKIFAYACLFFVIISVPIFLGFYFYSSELILLLSDNSFLATKNMAGSDTVLIFLASGLILSFFSSLASFTLVAFHRQFWVMLINFSGALFNVIANYYLIPVYGFMGASYTTIVSELFILILAVFFIFKLFKPQIFWKKTFYILFLGGLNYYFLYYFKVFVSLENILLEILLALLGASLIYGLGIYYGINNLYQIIFPKKFIDK